MGNISFKNIRIPCNPDWVEVGDLVLFISRENGTQQLQIGEVISDYKNGFKVKNLKTNKICYPYTQDTFLINSGVEIYKIKSTLEYVQF